MQDGFSKKVLIALDYNPTAQKVAETGFSLARAMNAEITILHVISDPVYYFSTSYSPIMGFDGFVNTGFSELESTTVLKNASKEFLRKTRDHLGDKTIKIQVEEGDFAEAILKTAERIHSDLIVLGSHSRKWLENIIMGSVTEEVLRRSQVPLFIIPTKKTD